MCDAIHRACVRNHPMAPLRRKLCCFWTVGRCSVCERAVCSMHLCCTAYVSEDYGVRPRTVHVCCGCERPQLDKAITRWDEEDNPEFAMGPRLGVL